MKYSHLWLCAVLAACSVYDDGLIGRHSNEAQPQSAESPTSAAGTEAQDSASASASSVPAAGSGGAKPAAGSGAAGSASQLMTPDACGNGKLDDGERCDTAIAQGKSGACPRQCSSDDPCQARTLEGSGCNAECRVSMRGCQNSDKCCPSQCNHQNDSDCSAKCGDGIVDSALGETCETGPNTPANQRCPTEVNCEDGDPCTIGVLEGSAAQCNAVCKQEPITARHGDDGCCPAGADSTVDSDCLPKCGNGVKESGEVCDGTTGCDRSCQQTLSSAQVQCLDQLAGDACERCECTHCSAEMLACSKSGNTKRDAACSDVEECATKHECAAEDCYCGSVSILFCSVIATGPCRTEIESASGTFDTYEIQADFLDNNTALGRAKNLGVCRRSYCSDVCPPAR